MSTRNTFLDCPVDVVLLIIHHLDNRSLLQLRLACRYLHDVTSPLALRTICFRSSSASQTMFNSGLSDHAIPLSTLAQIVKELVVQADPTDGDYEPPIEHRLTVLLEIVRKLTSLESLSLEWQGSVDEDLNPLTAFDNPFLEGVASSVAAATGGELEYLSLRPAPGAIHWPQSLQEFVHLKSLHVHFKPGFYSDGDVEATLELARELVKGNTRLETLTWNTSPSTGAEELFQSQSGELRSLTIDGIRFPNVFPPTVPYFRNLRYLDVKSALYNYPVDKLWFSLIESQTNLETLISAQISQALVSYLGSYTGLRELSLNLLPSSDIVDLVIVSSFFNDGLSTHTSTLEAMTLRFPDSLPVSETWCFSPSIWMPALEQMSVLTSFTCHPYIVASEYSSQSIVSVVPMDHLLERYQEVLSHVSRIPSLDFLRIPYSERPGCWCKSCRERTKIPWLRETGIRILQAAKRLRSDTGTPKVLKLFAGEYESQKIREGEDTGLWEYVLRKLTVDVDVPGLSADDLVTELESRS